MPKVLNWWMDAIEGYEKNGLAMKRVPAS